MRTPTTVRPRDDMVTTSRLGGTERTVRAARLRREHPEHLRNQPGAHAPGQGRGILFAGPHGHHDPHQGLLAAAPERGVAEELEFHPILIRFHPATPLVPV